MIVTIDGPAGSGKSTAARELARRLGFRFLDTGAMYRAVAWHCLRQGVDPEDQAAAAKAAAELTVEFMEDRVLIDGVDVTAAIRGAQVTHAASLIAMNPDVRRRLVELQRQVAAQRNIVTEGRDQGTIVFPSAECKFYLTADPQERAVRRQAQLKAEGVDVSLEEIVEQIRDRDLRDRNRKDSPLKQADDALRINTSGRTVEDVLAELERNVRERMATVG